MVTLPSRGVTMNFFRRPIFVSLFSDFQIYRKLYGGRWVNHWISICGPAVWTPLDKDHPLPDLLIGGPIVETWPSRIKDKS